MSRARHTLALSQCLLDALVGERICAEASLFELASRPDPDDPEARGPAESFEYVTAGPHRPERVAVGADVLEAANTLTAVCSDPRGSRIAVPVAGAVGSLRVVVMEGVTADPLTRMRALQLVEIFGNLAALMDGRERDELTGLRNRRLFPVLFDMARRRAEYEASARLTVAVCDIDRFKRINDGYGHLSGDRVLVRFAQLMKRHFRIGDQLFRFGGEEFVVLLTAPPEIAAPAMERFREAVAGHDFPVVGRVTVSIGFARCCDVTSPTSAVDRADRALYRAKMRGRNRTVSYAETRGCGILGAVVGDAGA